MPLEHVFVVELDDAEKGVVGTLWEDTVHRRRMPGDGDLDTAAFVAAMHDAGRRGHWGVEIISDEHRSLPVEEGTRVAFEKTSQTLDAAENVPAFRVDDGPLSGPTILLPTGPHPTLGRPANRTSAGTNLVAAGRTKTTDPTPSQRARPI